MVACGGVGTTHPPVYGNKAHPTLQSNMRTVSPHTMQTPDNLNNRDGSQVPAQQQKGARITDYNAHIVNE